jgi:NAD(P)-dependent dehydrogenase (short-subunit alcohol dehydrogenase family)
MVLFPSMKKIFYIIIPITTITILKYDLTNLPIDPKHRMGILSFPFLNHRTSQLNPIQPRSLEDKVAIVTGGSSGIGLETVKALVSGGATVVLTSRSHDKGEEARQWILSKYPLAKIHVLTLDLSNLKDIQRFKKEIKNLSLPSIDILVLNAGLFLTKEPVLNENGLELMFASHHIGHFYLFQLLKDYLLNSNEGRVVITSSALLGRVNNINYDSITNIDEAKKLINDNPVNLYAQSKFANVLFAKELTKKFPKLIISSNQPGLVATPIHKENEWITKIPGLCYTAEEGAMGNVLGSVGSRQLVHDKLVLPRAVIADWDKEVSKDVQNPLLAKELWNWTEDIIKKLINDDENSSQ